MINTSDKSFSSSSTELEFMRTSKFTSDYKILKKLGKGTFAEVFMIKNAENGKLESVKVIPKGDFASLTSSEIMNEITVLSKISHPNIVKMRCFYETSKHYYIVSEYLAGGDLFQQISAAQRFSESETAFFMQQILKAVSFLHKNRIVHRDLKPENIVFETDSKDSTIKLVDFGTSAIFMDKVCLKSKKGTLEYMAPEVWTENYDSKCDIWSCGVIMFVCLFGYLPFEGNNDREIMQNIKKGVFNFSRSIEISQSAKNLICLMLCVDPKRRPSADELLNCQWFNILNKESSVQNDNFSNFTDSERDLNRYYTTTVQNKTLFDKPFSTLL